MSTIRLPMDLSIGRLAPRAAAIGCSISITLPAPARRAASFTARISTSVRADGTQITTRGRLNRFTPTWRKMARIICSVMSKSVMAPLRRGRWATM